VSIAGAAAQVAGTVAGAAAQVAGTVAGAAAAAVVEPAAEAAAAEVVEPAAGAAAAEVVEPVAGAAAAVKVALAVQVVRPAGAAGRSSCKTYYLMALSRRSFCKTYLFLLCRMLIYFIAITKRKKMVGLILSQI